MEQKVSSTQQDSQTSYQDLSIETRRLIDRVYDLGDFFQDMLLDEESIVHDYVMVSYGDDGTLSRVSNEALDYFSYTDYSFAVLPLNAQRGFFAPNKKRLCIALKYLHDDAAILHEMIHLHEHFITGLSWTYHDMLCWCLYRDLKQKIPALDDIIAFHAHQANSDMIRNAGGEHSILFLLKSLDLDIKKGYSLGTVFAYGYEKHLNRYTYIDPDFLSFSFTHFKPSVDKE